MKIVITDVNRIWTPDHPALEQFADDVRVVCLNGEKVTDKYKCIVSPFRYTGLGFVPLGLDSAKLQALRSIENRLVNELVYDDILFLTDIEAEGLYPFTVIKDKGIGCSLHLFSIEPWRVESLNKKKAIYSILSDLSALKSVVFLEEEYSLWRTKRTATLPELVLDVQKLCGELLPSIISQIQKRKWDRAFYDIQTRKYIPLKEDERFEDTFGQTSDFPDIDLIRSGGLMGVVEEPVYPSRNKDVFDEIEAGVPRIDGKRICRYLRKLRTKLAEANQIPFESVDCHYIGPCAGTCRKCDMESEYLRQEMGKIAPEKRVYPFEELTSWEVI